MEITQEEFDNIKAKLDSMEQRLVKLIDGKKKEPEVDWSKVTMLTPVLYRPHKSPDWVKGRFNYYNVDNDEIVIIDEDGDIITCAECKLDPDADSIINWIPNTGASRGDREGFEILVSNNIHGIIWPLKRKDSWALNTTIPVTHYAYVRLPQ